MSNIIAPKGLRGTSSKTRIETGIIDFIGDGNIQSLRGTSSKTRIETQFPHDQEGVAVAPKRNFQQNKD